MKHNSMFAKVLFVSLSTLVILACGVTSLESAPTQMPTPTTLPTNSPVPTNTLAPTSTPRPTATEVPPTPTPAAKGEAVTDGKIEVTLLELIRHDKVVTGGTYYWTPNPGYIIIDIFAKIKNLKTGSVSIKWSDVNIAGGGTGGLVFAGAAKAVNAKEKVAPLSFGYFEIPEGSEFTFDDTVYLQAIYFVTSDTEFVLFSVEGGPQIQVHK